MNVELVKLSHKYKEQLFDVMDEWIAYGKKFIPYSIFKNDYHDFDYYMNSLEVHEPMNGMVPDSAFFCLDIDRNIFVGAVSIRHYLNDKLINTGGHIGVGVRPSERRKGYATAMIHLALNECKKLNMKEVLMTCNKNNIASVKSIIKNGGILENEIIVDNSIVQRYWITL
ncbi:MAG: GNAT family N-acetyltransferase [Alphaproteobacteria bacterium]|nr:GNAT family N-acetyltransferase [Alphaproteobacteria bacterium]